MTTTHAVALVERPSGAVVPAVPSLGNLDAYISAVNRLPMLSAEEESSLARRFQEHQDVDAARTLVTSHLRLVVSVARQYLGYGLPHADLIQEGNIGLMKAVKRFDPSRSVRLVSFALHWIKAEIHEYILKNWRLVKVATTKAQRKLFFNLRSMKKGLDTLTPEAVTDIAEQLNVREKDVIEMETRMGGQDLALEPQGDDEHGSSFGPAAYLAAPGSEPSEIIESRQRDRLQTEGLSQALAGLDARSRKIIESRWLRDEDEGGSRTLQDLADEYGVSAERIRQIEAQAMKKMKAALANYV
ncbi:MAG: RNA polymerase sigma factor RpoH [Lautropia sp.]|nr:RNA polymerase sigma factor RpoH [Lautropia sp.]